MRNQSQCPLIELPLPLFSLTEANNQFLEGESHCSHSYLSKYLPTSSKTPTAATTQNIHRPLRPPADHTHDWFNDKQVMTNLRENWFHQTELLTVQVSTMINLIGMYLHPRNAPQLTLPTHKKSQ